MIVYTDEFKKCKRCNSKNTKQYYKGNDLFEECNMCGYIRKVATITISTTLNNYIYN